MRADLIVAASTANVPLFALPQDVALRVPATQSYSYAWLGGRAWSTRRPGRSSPT